MNRTMLRRGFVIGALAVAVAAAVVLKGGGKESATTTAAAPAATALPRLVDLGADKCVPCKMMAPVLAELRTEYAGRFEVDFIDVWKRPGQVAGVRHPRDPDADLLRGRRQGTDAARGVLRQGRDPGPPGARYGHDFSSPPES